MGSHRWAVWGSDVDPEEKTGTHTHVDTDANTYMKISL